jgi:hypothetical protein
MTAHSQTNNSIGDIIVTDVFTRHGQTNLVRIVTESYIDYSFYHDGELTARLLQERHGSTFATAAGAFCTSVKLGPSKEIQSIEIGDRDGRLLDELTYTNGLFWPTEASLKGRSINSGVGTSSRSIPKPPDMLNVSGQLKTIPPRNLRSRQDDSEVLTSRKLEPGNVSIPNRFIFLIAATNTSNTIRFSVTVAPNASTTSPRVEAYLMLFDGQTEIVRRPLHDLQGRGASRFEFEVASKFLAHSQFVLRDLGRRSPDRPEPGDSFWFFLKDFAGTSTTKHMQPTPR